MHRMHRAFGPWSQFVTTADTLPILEGPDNAEEEEEEEEEEEDDDDDDDAVFALLPWTMLPCRMPMAARGSADASRFSPPVGSSDSDVA
jgi:hypothetical protein